MAPCVGDRPEPRVTCSGGGGGWMAVTCSLGSLLRGLSLWLVRPLGPRELRVSFGTCEVPVSGASTDPHGQVCSRVPPHVPHLERGAALGKCRGEEARLRAAPPLSRPLPRGPWGTPRPLLLAPQLLQGPTQKRSHIWRGRHVYWRESGAVCVKCCSARSVQL